MLIGLAAAIKLTPALFLVFAVPDRPPSSGADRILTFLAFTGLGAILLFDETVAFFGGSVRRRHPDSLAAVRRQPVPAGGLLPSRRLLTATTLIGLGISALVALLGTLVAAHWWRLGHKVFAVALAGLTTCLASPLSWTHHYVWILPFAVAVFRARPGQVGALPRRVLGGVGLGVPAAGPAAVRLGQGAAVRRGAAAGRQPRAARRRGTDRRTGLAAGGQHPAPRTRCSGEPAGREQIRLTAMTVSATAGAKPSGSAADGVDIKPRSRVVTDGLEATASRGMLRAVGMADEDWDKPQIGVASSWNEITPCNLSLDRLAKAVKDGVHAAGGYPLEFGTISVSDGISMGHEGMHFSLVSREIIADSVETVMSAERLDGSVLLAGCDKSLPGMLMAAARLDLAVGVPLRRVDHARPGGGPGRHDHRRLRGGRGLRPRPDHPRAGDRDREGHLSRRGRLRRHVHRQHDGLGRRGAGHVPARVRGAARGGPAARRLRPAERDGRRSSCCGAASPPGRS